jgi:sugar phosphate isomerase/epimerase
MEIGASSWSFHAELYSGKLRLAGVPYRVYELGLRVVELQDMFLWPKPPGLLARLRGRKAPPFDRYAYDAGALQQLKLTRLRSGTRLACWAIDSDLTAHDFPERQKQKAYLAAAIQTAAYLGAPLIRLTLGGESARDVPSGRAMLDRAADLLRNVLPVAVASGVNLAIENHGGLSANPDRLAELIEQVNSPSLGICVDLGNFEDDAAHQNHALRGIERLAPHALHVHAKARSFRSDGEEATIDYRTCLRVLKSSGYDGVISIEYEGDGDAARGIQQTRDLIEKYWS